MVGGGALRLIGVRGEIPRAGAIDRNGCRLSAPAEEVCRYNRFRQFQPFPVGMVTWLPARTACWRAASMTGLPALQRTAQQGRTSAEALMNRLLRADTAVAA